LGINVAVPTLPLDVTDQLRVGKVKTGTWPAAAGYAYWGNESLNFASFGTYAILQFTDGNTYVNAGAGAALTMRINNSDGIILNSNLRTGIGSTPDANGRLYVYGEGTGNNFLSIANCNGIATTSSSGRTLAGYVRIYINNTVSNSGANTFTAGQYYIAVYS
jgi:hypothetical protein